MNRSRSGEAGIRPEMELLIRAIRVDREDTGTIRTLLQKNEIKWPEFFRLVQAHGILPTVYDHFRTIPGCGIPKDVWDDMKISYRSNLYRNIIHSRQLVWIFDTFSGRGIEMIPFKGIVLAVQAYKNPDLRRCGDIDILVRERDLPEIVAILQEYGFSPHLPFTKKTGPRLMHLIKGSDTFSRAKSVDLDVHWRISDFFSRFPMDLDFFRNKKTIELFDDEIPCLSLEDTLIFLSVHGTKHFWQEIRWIVDIIQLIENNPSIDIPYALSEAEERGCRRLVCIALHLAEIMGGITFGKDVENLLHADNRSRSIAMFFYDNIREEKIPDAFSQISVLMRSQERFSDSVRFGAYGLFFFTPPGGYAIPLPRSLHPLYFIIGGAFLFRRG